MDSKSVHLCRMMAVQELISKFWEDLRSSNYGEKDVGYVHNLEEPGVGMHEMYALLGAGMVGRSMLPEEQAHECILSKQDSNLRNMKEHHIKAVILWRNETLFGCLEVFVRWRMRGASGSLQVRRIDPDRYMGLWQRMEGRWVEIRPSSLLLFSVAPGNEGEEEVDAAGKGLRSTKLCVEPWLHGVGEAGLGIVDHGDAGGTNIVVLDSIFDESQHEWLEVVRGVKVAVFRHVLLEVGASAWIELDH